MNYAYLIIGILAAVHAFSYGYWLMKNSNFFGGLVVFVIVMASLALPVYRLMTAR